MARLSRLPLITFLFVAASGALALACGPDPTLPPGDDFGEGVPGAGAAAGASVNAHAGTSSFGTGGSGAAGSGGQGVGTGGTGMLGAGGTPALGGATATAGSSAMGGRGGQGASGNGGINAGGATFGQGGAGGASNGGMASAGRGTVFGGARGGSPGLGGRSGGGAGGSGGARAGAGGIGMGAAGSGTGGAASSVPFSQVAAIIQAQCGKSTCHGGRENPNLTNTNLTTLYNTLTGTTVRQCGSDHLVTKNDTANSALLELPQGQCGNFIMPQGCTKTPCLQAADLTTITNWINAGAPGP
jgi:hypothetical protein